MFLIIVGFFPVLVKADGLTKNIAKMDNASIIEAMGGMSSSQINVLINEDLSTTQVIEVYEKNKELVNIMTNDTVKKLIGELSGQPLQEFVGVLSTSTFKTILPDLPDAKLNDITEGSNKEKRKLIVDSLKDERLGDLLVAVTKPTRTNLVELLRQKCGSSSSSSSRSSSSTTTVKKKKKESPCGDTGTCHEPQIPTEVP